MRLAAVAKMGFYPIRPGAIDLIAKHLRIPKDAPTRGTMKADEVNIIDPCAGEGVAVKRLADALGIAPDRTYAVELDGGRADKCRENLPEGNVLGPAGFLGSQITGFTMSLAYVNPPFDDELGGGRREEQSFATRATHLLVPKGVLAMVVPIRALAGNREFCKFLDCFYEDIRVWEFPPELRPYNEIVVIGTKRRVELPGEAVYRDGGLHKMGLPFSSYGWEDRLSVLGDAEYKQVFQQRTHGTEDHPTYNLPPAWRPNTFKKVAYADGELEKAMERSPLNALLRERPPQAIASPPLPLGKGHVALLLASGMLDGTVEGPDGFHVVRGTARKVEYVNHAAGKTEENPETGALTTKTVFSQKIVLTIRAVDAIGEIRTFSDAPAKAADDADEGDDSAQYDDTEVEVSLNSGKAVKTTLGRMKKVAAGHR